MVVILKYINFMTLIPESFVEDLKNKILAALFSKNTGQLKILIGYATDTAKNPEIGETDEKYLRQALTALIRHKHLLDKATGLKQQTKHLKKLLADKVRQADPGHME